MTTIVDGIVIGGAGGAIAGLTVWLVQYLHDKVTQKLESNRVFKWLKENTTNEPGEQFRSSRAIASWNNLTQERVRHICSVDKRIFLSTGEKEDMWGKRHPGDVAENRDFISLSHAMQIPMAEIARHVGVCGSAVIKAIQKMESADQDS